MGKGGIELCISSAGGGGEKTLSFIRVFSLQCFNVPACICTVAPNGQNFGMDGRHDVILTPLDPPRMAAMT
jgi:hypothetical protein